MALMTGEQYEESLRKLNLKVYLLGDLVTTWSIIRSSGPL